MYHLLQNWGLFHAWMNNFWLLPLVCGHWESSKSPKIILASTFQRVLSPNCQGLLNIESLLEQQKWTPRFFIVNSSVSSVLGNVGQTNYSAANGFADTFIRERRLRKMSGNSINWVVNLFEKAQMFNNWMLTDIFLQPVISREIGWRWEWPSGAVSTAH
jgi:hypothetical protein